MTKILAIDTSAEACSVALGLGDEVLETFEVMPRLHARRVLPMVQDLLAQADLALTRLDAIAFGRGPGSFTGLRICAGVVQGLAFGADLPTVPVSSLATLAQGAHRSAGHAALMTVLDARMAELYWACFKVVDGLVQPLAEERLTSPEALIEACPLLTAAPDWVGVGDGWQMAGQFPPALLAEVTPLPNTCYPHAQDIVTLARPVLARGEAVSAEQALPVYLRGKSAWKKAK